MQCEPIYFLPQQIDLDELRKSNEPYAAAQNLELKAEQAKRNVTHVQQDYKILPIFSHSSAYLNSILSLKENKYLQCKWYEYLDKIPDKCVHICLYSTLMAKSIKPKPMQLNGNFYGIDNKLAPIPYFSDPRQYDKTNFGKCQRSQKKNK